MIREVICRPEALALGRLGRRLEHMPLLRRQIVRLPSLLVALGNELLGRGVCDDEENPRLAVAVRGAHGRRLDYLHYDFAWNRFGLEPAHRARRVDSLEQVEVDVTVRHTPQHIMLRALP